jgi:hypothetical protein
MEMLKLSTFIPNKQATERRYRTELVVAGDEIY